MLGIMGWMGSWPLQDADAPHQCIPYRPIDQVLTQWMHRLYHSSDLVFDGIASLVDHSCKAGCSV